MTEEQPVDGVFAFDTSKIDELVERSTSAPTPLFSDNVFAYNTGHAGLFTDITSHENYQEFYNTYGEVRKLPVPLETQPWNMNGNSDEKENVFSYEPKPEADPEEAGTTPTESPGLWSPLPKKVASLVLDDIPEEPLEQQPEANPESSAIFPFPINSPINSDFMRNYNDAKAKDPNSKIEHRAWNIRNAIVEEKAKIESSNGVNPPAAETKGQTYAYATKKDVKEKSQIPKEPTQQEHPDPNNELSNGNANGNGSNMVCRYYAQGYCSRGDRCNFLHQNGDGTVPTKVRTKKFNPEWTSIEQVAGNIYALCKDQHGCRFLQKVLEEKDASSCETIFNEIYEHMVELMTDPFGNYLCQKLLEYCTDAQRLMVIETVAPYLVEISKNMHGTRAVQKMIDYLNSTEQVQQLKRALSSNVVSLIQDLNGNHVIQRCLNRFSAEDKQFIYDAVTSDYNCVEVATHRHGCCVLQRCIDYASDAQKAQLVHEISQNALILVQDPFGNYVVQYVLDLNLTDLVDNLIEKLLGHIVVLSTQKFSSNVIEKCLHVGSQTVKTKMVQELVETDQLIHLLQDPFANYVIQTGLSVALPDQHQKLVNSIKPHLQVLRNTPYGKRIQSNLITPYGEQ